MKMSLTARSMIPLVFAATLMVTTAPVVAQDKPKNVVGAQNVNPNEAYNLPGNFDPNYKPKGTPKNIRVNIDFQQAQLAEVVKFYSSLLNRNFIIADSLQASKSITIISPKPVTIAEAYRAFLMALNMNGLTVVESGSFLKIVASKSSIQEPSNPINPGKTIPNEARMVTAILPVEKAPVQDVQQVIQQFLSQDATVIVYQNNLIIHENASNLRRIQRLIEQLDQGSPSGKVFVYKVAYADVGDIQARLQEIFSLQAGPKGAQANRPTTNQAKGNNQAVTVDGSQGVGELDVQVSQIVGDERTNQLIIVTDERSFKRIRQMIELLDVPTAVGGQIHVKTLEYANAEDLASTLSGLANGQRSGGSANTRRAQNTQQRQPQSNSAQGGVAQLLQGDVQITAYKPTNSLIIIASPRDYLALEKVISSLDRPRKQVYVEAVIMEIGLDVNSKLGLGANAIAGQDFNSIIPQSAIESGAITSTQGGILVQSNYGGGVADILSGAGGLGLIGPPIALTLAGLNVSLPSFALILQATQTDNSVNVLSTPSILTLDNEEAEIVVGDRVPFLQGLSAGQGLGNLLGGVAGGNLGGAGAALGGLLGGGLISPINYEDVGITLRILPQVNQSNYVRLEVDQEVSDIKGAGGLGTGAPIRTKRNIKNVVLVRDQSTVVIGGLIREVENETINKVPLLGDVPLIGVLFRKNSTIKNKQNLVLMLTPYIIEDEEDLRKIYERKRQEREELLKLFQKRDLGYMRSVDYDKKGGLLDRMRGRIGQAVKEEMARREALKAFEDNSPRYRILSEDEGGAAPDATPVEDSAAPAPVEGDAVPLVGGEE
jgi:general secretion pathway protein D